jgi:beta-galactosidase
VNDRDAGTPLKDTHLRWRLTSKSGHKVVGGELAVGDVPYYATATHTVSIPIPERLPTADYLLVGELIEGKRTLSRNETRIFIASRPSLKPLATTRRELLLYDPKRITSAAFERRQISFKLISQLKDIPSASVLIFGEGASDGSVSAGVSEIKQFMKSGGRVLCLRQEPEQFSGEWLPEPIQLFKESPNSPRYPPANRPFRANMAINPERPEHPVFTELPRERLFLWSDCSGWDESKPGFPCVYPVTSGFKLESAESLARTAVLADYDRGLEGIALCEMFIGKGSAILCAFDLISRLGQDPAADRLLNNLVAYASSDKGHELYPLVEKSIVWGDYRSEHGVVCGSMNGLLLNADWSAPKTNRKSKRLTQAEGAWNTRPGDGFVPSGRSPAGPYGYTTSSSLKDLNPESSVGSGRIWIRIPPGKRKMITVVRNPSDSVGQMTIKLNGKPTAPAETVPAGTRAQIETPLEKGTTELCIEFEGTKALVLVSTEFR